MTDEAKCAFSVEYPMITKILNDQMESVVAEVMTIMEASMPEGSSREAAKNLVKKAVWRGSDKIKALLLEQKR